MKKVLLSLLLFHFILLSCENSQFIYQDCLSDKPVNGELKLRVSIKDSTSAIPVCIYAGVYENGTLLFKDTLRVSEKSFELPVNANYSATAEYVKENTVIIAVDGGKISVSQHEDEYGNDCWNLKNASLDLRLK